VKKKFMMEPTFAKPMVPEVTLGNQTMMDVIRALTESFVAPHFLQKVNENQTYTLHGRVF